MPAVNLSSLVSYFTPPSPLPDWNDVTFQGNFSNGGSSDCNSNYGRPWFFWCVPSGVTRAEFHIWGAGGIGAGSCCCQQTIYQSGGGAYAFQTGVTVTPGSVYQVFVGNSACCLPSCAGQQGCFSCVCGTGVNICVQGGFGGYNSCFYGYGSWPCCGMIGMYCLAPTYCTCGYGSYTCVFPGRYGGLSTTSYGGCAEYVCGIKFMSGAGASSLTTGRCNIGNVWRSNGVYIQQACGGWGKSQENAYACGYGCYNSPSNAGLGGFNSHTCGGGCCCGGWAHNGLAIIRYK